ncbi:DUF4282 domain-containing protein [bacterium]|nr:DUF4282 domain-containing protein [candidate division CSSED10-310 bacterium]
MGDFLTFRRMITPIIIQIIFWLGILGCLIGFLMSLTQGFEGFLAGLLILILGPILIRIYCEVLIVIFRVNETLTDIKNLLQKRPA